MKIRDVTSLWLRVPPEVHAWVKKEAVNNRRSVNSEILVCLEETRRMREATRPEDHAR